MTLHKRYLELGAELAGDGIPLHYGNLQAEYDAAHHKAVLLDRSHEGRLHITGEHRFEFLNRMSTNQMLNMAEHEGRATVFTNATGRIIQRIIAYNSNNLLQAITEPGQGEFLQQHLQKQIFFNDKVAVSIHADTHQFALHGPEAEAIMQPFAPDLAPLYSLQTAINGHAVFIARRKPLIHSHWVIITASANAASVYEAILDAGQNKGLQPAGSLTYNTIRIEAGRPAGRELSSDYIPLEVGLWDEISFNKGCYTGQEIIARMESRAQLAKILVHLQLSSWVEAPTPIQSEGRTVGTLTSSFKTPLGKIAALGIIKTELAFAANSLTIDGQPAQVLSLAGTAPAYLNQ